ncbi:MAG TPA: symmetrical bis(5'-nucleosyl)-tetraphosphatase [Gammaproteobacteria bacterium]|jgi:bis(5'-nucleosyl)-tetraphosphatase (symmetrical)|nr:symmetrical bis(5'-nucleosyl)-tetraphosphatase [Gammaproteobacteria bacterium]
MATFAIGDVQGCYDDLMRLLERIHFDEQDDQLWFAGDLVNRGPDSLGVLRFVRGLGERAVSVLGNHDLHLLAVAAGTAELRDSDTLDAILDAEDRDEHLDWLRHRPVLHHDAGLGYTLVHAGLPPQWDLHQAQACAHELEEVLCGSAHAEFFRRMYGDEPRRWRADLKGVDRLRFIVNCFTRLRYCSAAGDLELRHKGAPGTQPAACLPWFEVPGRASAGLHVLFGHWSTLGEVRRHNVYPLDTGCVWGGRLTALRLDGDGSDSWYCVDCQEAQSPKGD